MSRKRFPQPTCGQLGWKARRIPCASLLLSAVAAFVFFLPSLAAQLEYDRAAIAGGEIWRLFSGHWAHYSFDHFVWDVLAFGFLGLACERRSRSSFLVCVAASAFAISLSVWFCLPGMTAYRGLSGVDSGLFALLVVELWSEGLESRRPGQVAIAAACLAGFLLKISFELVTGNNLFVERLGSGTVGVPLAHIVGATVGLLVGLGTVDVNPAGTDAPRDTNLFNLLNPLNLLNALEPCLFTRRAFRGYYSPDGCSPFHLLHRHVSDSRQRAVRRGGVRGCERATQPDSGARQ